MQRRLFLASFAAAAAAGALTAFGKKEASAPAAAAASSAAAASAPAELRPLVVGVTAGVSEVVAEVVKKEAEKAGLKVTLKTFGDYQTPNAALAHGEIDINTFQHGPFLEAYNANNKTDLVSVAPTYLAPLALYSRKIKTADEIKDGAQIAIPSDPTNGGRALQLLAKQGWIKLKDGVPATKVTKADITEYVKKIKIIELEAPQLPRSLDDTTASVINAGYAQEAKLTKQDQIVVEDNTSPYVNIIAARKGTENDPSIQKYIAVFHSKAVKDFIESKYPGQIVVAW